MGLFRFSANLTPKSSGVRLKVILIPAHGFLPLEVPIVVPIGTEMEVGGLEPAEDLRPVQNVHRQRLRVGAGEDEGAAGRRLGAASMKKKKNNEPAKGGHGLGIFDLMGVGVAGS
ncbi:hypothetical protein FH972_016775 [Carpinus fangiana]|uniref:Uncharacterized protein n=1 Tax=Carpinus fangiana TaxID=176857 RepID=A0A5N6RGX6_9ROSI|nr:hypothetical protein FH972_016775 [Carpinus fangiana]